MSLVQQYYQRLSDEVADKPDRLSLLVFLSQYDERVLYFLRPHSSALLSRVFQHDASAARCLSRAVFYTREFGDECLRQFVSISSALSRSDDIAFKVPVGDLIRNLARIQPYRSELINYSESYRHLLITRDPFHERAVTSCLAYIFCDDFLGDAIAKLQYKTDVLNYVNNIFVRTVDYSAWRYSVRCLSIAGGYNEDQTDVDRVRAMSHLLTCAVPEALTYLSIGYLYARIRHTPRGLYKPFVPRWVAARRSLLSAVCTTVLGVYSGAYATWAQDQLREKYSAARQREFRRRAGAEYARIRDFQEQPIYDDNRDGTRFIARSQFLNGALTAGALFLTLMPTYPTTIPRWMGDVRLKDPWLPIYFPVLMGVPAPSRRLIPYVIAPFLLGKCVVNGVYGTTTIHDWMVYRRGLGQVESKESDAVLD